MASSSIGFQGVHVDNSDRQLILGLQNVGSLDSAPDTSTTGDDGEVGAVTEGVGLTNGEVLNRLIVNRLVKATVNTNIYRSLMLVGGLNGLCGGHTSAGFQHNHACEGPHNCDVLGAVVSGTGLAEGGARVGSDNLDVRVSAAKVGADLLTGAHQANAAKVETNGCSQRLRGQRRYPSCFVLQYRR